RRAGREVCHGDPSPVEKDGLTLATNKTILTRQFPIPRGAFQAIFILLQTIHFSGNKLAFYMSCTRQIFPFPPRSFD
ncbi:hypothetical protein NQU50_31355, partial [Escherichia coli]|uniref:hypothetical protein n=1 Tax=Escherichia coli TaxID=562 RepID=UPI002117B4E3